MLRAPAAGWWRSPVRFDDLTGAVCFDRDRHDLDTRGLYLDVPAWGYHVFDVSSPENRRPG